MNIITCNCVFAVGNEKNYEALKIRREEAA